MKEQKEPGAKRCSGGRAILPRAAARHGDKAALVVGERALTYAELERDSNRLANALIGLGVAPGDRVTL